MGSTAMDAEEVTSLVQRLQNIKPSTIQDEKSRKILFEATRDLFFRLESSGDSIQRIASTSLQTTAAKLASDLHIFELLSNAKTSVFTTKQLAETTKADEVLLGRILRYLASVAMVDEVGEDVWTANNITRTLSVPGLKAGIYHNHDNILPCWQALPEFLVETRYQNPSDGAHSPFQKAHRTDQMPFDWALAVPSRFDNFLQWMMANREGQNIFLDVYPFESEHCYRLKPETPLFVDVGGGIGHMCVELKDRLPHVPGRVINQDLPPAIAQAIQYKGVEHTIHDFTKAQPVQGARVYYLRNIMHDWPDDKCILILKQIIDVMNKDSVLLIDDMVLPNQGAHWRATQLDLAMMAGLAAMERTEKQWYSMLEAAGLTVKKIYTYTPDLRDSVIVAIPK